MAAPSTTLGAHGVKEQSDCETGSGSIIGTEVRVPFQALLFKERVEIDVPEIMAVPGLAITALKDRVSGLGPGKAAREDLHEAGP